MFICSLAQTMVQELTVSFSSMQSETLSPSSLPFVLSPILHFTLISPSLVRTLTLSADRAVQMNYSTASSLETTLG